MVLVDTSVWIEHFRSGSIGLERLLNEDLVVCHLFIIGELACGNLSNRSEILSLLQALPPANHAEHEEVMHVIENYSLMGKGLGLIDMHLIASAMLTKVPIWTLDKKLKEVSSKLGLEFDYCEAFVAGQALDCKRVHTTAQSLPSAAEAIKL